MQETSRCRKHQNVGIQHLQTLPSFRARDTSLHTTIKCHIFNRRAACDLQLQIRSYLYRLCGRRRPFTQLLIPFCRLDHLPQLGRPPTRQQRRSNIRRHESAHSRDVEPRRMVDCLHDSVLYCDIRMFIRSQSMRQHQHDHSVAA